MLKWLRQWWITRQVVGEYQRLLEENIAAQAKASKKQLKLLNNRAKRLDDLKHRLEPLMGIKVNPIEELTVDYSRGTIFLVKTSTKVTLEIYVYISDSKIKLSTISKDTKIKQVTHCNNKSSAIVTIIQWLITDKL